MNEQISPWESHLSSLGLCVQISKVLVEESLGRCPQSVLSLLMLYYEGFSFSGLAVHSVGTEIGWADQWQKMWPQPCSEEQKRSLEKNILQSHCLLISHLVPLPLKTCDL